jgi:hypothetical protein
MPREDKNTFGEMRESGSLCIASAVARSRWTPAAGLMICASPISSRDSPARFAATGAESDQATRPQEWAPNEIHFPRPFADPEKAARRILGIANAVEPIQGRHIEKINESFLFRDRGSPAEYGAGLKLAIERGWLKTHESGTFVTFTPA